jgi:hypothetical protein
MNRHFALGLVLAAGLLACFTPSQRREDELMQHARQWNDDFRWGRWDVLGQSMTGEENTLFQERRRLIEADLVMADYEVTAVKFIEASQAATVDARIEWYTKSEPSVRQTGLQQRWERRTGRWMMVRQRRVRGDRFPLVTEPASETGAPAAAAPDTASRPASP